MGKNDLASTSKQAQHQLTITIPENLETTLPDEYCIYKVPPTLRQINPPAYTPKVVSIGPIHHGKPELLDMEIQKLRYLKEFCKRKIGSKERESSSDPQKIKEEEIVNQKEFSSDLLNEINEEDIRHFYAVTFEFSSIEFVNLILLDTVFVIELFLRTKKAEEHGNDFIIGKPWLRTDVKQDLILLENQLPFSTLEKLYNFAKKNFVNPEVYPSFLELTDYYFSNFKPTKDTKIPYPNKKLLHFTDFVRRCWSFRHPPMFLEKGNESLYSITKLHQAGLKLKRVPKECFLDIKFKTGMTCLWRAELQLPCFEFDDTTEFVVRNLMALEQCHYPYESYICNYVRLWDLLIDTAEDVDLLVEKKIMVNGLGDSAAVANLVNNLCNQIVEVQSCYYILSIKLNSYYENCCNPTMATLRTVYFGDLWRGTGTAAAVVLLVLTLLQTIWTILEF